MTSSRFLVGMLAMLAMLAVVVGQVEPESELDCYDGEHANPLQHRLSLCKCTPQSARMFLTGWVVFDSCEYAPCGGSASCLPT